MRGMGMTATRSCREVVSPAGSVMMISKGRSGPVQVGDLGGGTRLSRSTRVMDVVFRPYVPRRIKGKFVKAKEVGQQRPRKVSYPPPE